MIYQCTEPSDQIIIIRSGFLSFLTIDYEVVFCLFFLDLISDRADPVDLILRLMLRNIRIFYSETI